MFSLDELSSEVTNRLAQLGMLGAAPDARVSAAPDTRTVRYYTTLGLLDRPRIENRQARYGQRHLLQLLVIKILQSQDLPLAHIQELMYGRSDAELQQMIDSTPPPREQTAPEPPALMLREVIVEPGLRLVADARWTAGDEQQLAKRIGAALRALNNGGTK